MEAKSPHELTIGTESDPIPVLICEDNIANQILLRHMCAKLNLSVDIASNGAIGVEKVVNNKYALVFMDLKMPEMDGLEATEQLRSLGYTDLPIIAVTANVSDSDRQSCFEAGMDDFMTKPINMHDLSRMVAKCGLEKDSKTSS